MINYTLLMKPGILMGNLVTFAAGFLLASRGSFDLPLFLATLFGLAFIMASACVLNNYIDRPLDRKMARTKDRPLVTGRVSGKNALIFAAILAVLGNATLYFFTNFLALLLANVGFFVYVVLYSLWKRHTIYGTAIGSVAGAVPPVVGYCAVSHQLDAGALILFAMLVLWQMPHFFSISLFHLRDYAAAGVPVLPVERGILRTQVQMLLYILVFIPVAGLLTFFEYTGYVYLAVATLIGLCWLLLCLYGFKSDMRQWSKRMFQLSLLVIGSICFVIPFDIG